MGNYLSNVNEKTEASAWIILHEITCIGENTEKYITFTVLLEKQVIRINKNGEEVTKQKYILHITIYW